MTMNLKVYTHLHHNHRESNYSQDHKSRLYMVKRQHINDMRENEAHQVAIKNNLRYRVTHRSFLKDHMQHNRILDNPYWRWHNHHHRNHIRERWNLHQKHSHTFRLYYYCGLAIKKIKTRKCLEENYLRLTVTNWRRIVHTSYLVKPNFFFTIWILGIEL